MSQLVAFTSTVLIIRLLLPISKRFGWMDNPGKRKKHTQETPFIGGIAMFGGLLISLFTIPISILPYKTYFAGCLILLMLGLFDDQYNIPAKAKLFIQVSTALLMLWWGGFVINSLGSIFLPGIPITLHYFAIPFTVCYIVGAINSSNMSDGMDGLAGGTSLIIHSALFGLAFWKGRENEAILLSLIILAIMGFLLFNTRILGRKMAVLFMGDGGSLILGYSVAWFSIRFTQGEDTIMRPIAALWIYAVPLIDMVSLILRRISRRKSPFSADRCHLHHILHRSGFGVNQTVVIIWAFAGSTVFVGIMGEILQVSETLMFWSFMGLLSGYCYMMMQAATIIRFFRRRKRKMNRTQKLTEYHPLP